MTDPAPPAGGPPRSGSIEAHRRAYEEGRGLLGYRSACGFTTATWGLRCPACGRADLGEVELPHHGRIVAYSVQHVPSDEFLNDAPYAYVIVELDGGPRVSGWIPTARRTSDLAVGSAVRWVPSYKAGVHFELETAPSPPGGA
jgi:uncharacterized OB-fold protein